MLTTSCKNCVFKIGESDQTGCHLNRLDKMPHTKDEDGNFVILKFCNGFRPERWKEDVGVSTIEEMIATVKHEMHSPINFVIHFKDSLEELKKTLESISRIQNLNKRSTLTVVNKKVEFNEEISEIIFRQNFHEDRIFLMFILDENQPILNNCFKNFNVGNMVTVWAGYEFPENFEDLVNKTVNEDMEKLYLIFDDNKYFTSTQLFKSLNGDLPLVLDNGEVDSDDYVNKICRRSGGNGVYNWSEYFA
jgi:hypothetical protein